MAQLMVAALGAAMGSIAGPGVLALGMTGAQMGWMAGSMLGSALFSETQKSQGPRLTDLRVIGSSYGTTIPYVQGHPRISGQIVWASDKREFANTQSAGGKGGPKQEYTSYTYNMDMLVLLCDNMIAGITKIWRDGELIYNVSLDADSETKQNSWGSLRDGRITVYTGAPDQLPDPTYEAAVGTANACAYRGRATVMFRYVQLGSSGAVPVFTFEVAQASNQSGLYNTYLVCRGDANKGIVDSSIYSRPITTVGSGTSIVESAAAVNASAVYTPWIGVLHEPPLQYASYISANMSDVSTSLPANAIQTLEFNFMAKSWETGYSVSDPTYNTILTIYNTSGQMVMYMCIHPDDSKLVINGTVNNSLPASLVTTGVWKHVAIVRRNTTEATNTAVYLDGTYFGEIGFYNWGTVGKVVFGNEGLYSVASELTYHRGVDVMYDEICWTDKEKYSSNFIPPTTQHPVYTHLPSYISQDTPVRNIVENILIKSGLSSDKYDTSGLDSLSIGAKGVIFSQVGPTRNLLDLLSQVYRFNSFCSDKLYFKPRAQSISAVIPYEDLGADGGDNIFNISKLNSLEIPTALSVTYLNPEKDYQNDTEYSDRTTSSQETISGISVPIVLSSTEAKMLTDSLLLEKYSEAYSSEIHVTNKYAYLQPLDVISIVDKDGDSVLMVVKKIQETDTSLLKLSVCSYNASIYTQTGLTTVTTPSSSVYGEAYSKLKILDIPPLRDVDYNIPGYYIAVDGSAGKWPGCNVYTSYYPIDNFTYKTSVYDQSTIGLCLTTLGNFSNGTVFDETNILDVKLPFGEVSSVTRDTMLTNSSINIALVGNEVIQFRDASLIADNTYRISGLIRGRRGTEAYISNHTSDERFILLGSGGIRFIPLQVSDIGKTFYSKAVTYTSTDTPIVESLVANANNIECFSPVDVRVDRSAPSTQLVISWKRRTRRVTGFTGTAGISVPLDETTEKYDVEIYSNSSFSVLKRTKSGLTTALATYTNAEQVADFGSTQTTLYLKIYQVSATVGRGTPITVTV